MFRQFTNDQCLKPGDEVVACACLAYNGGRLYNVGVVERGPIESVAKGRVGRDGPFILPGGGDLICFKNRDYDGREGEHN